MRTFMILLATASAFAVSAQRANAQEFTGPRAEVTAGYDTTRSDDGVAATPDTLDGARIGGAIGYDFALGSTFTLGGEAGIGFVASGDARYAAGTSSFRLTSGRDIDLALRLGARVAPRTLLFVKGGWANSAYRVRASIGGTTGITTTQVTTEEDGWRIGAGAEQALGNHLYAKAEYRYTDYGDDVSRHQVLAGLGYRF